MAIGTLLACAGVAPHVARAQDGERVDVLPDEVTAVGVGERLPQANPFDEGGRQFDRRVDVLVLAGQAREPTRD